MRAMVRATVWAMVRAMAGYHTPVSEAAGIGLPDGRDTELRVQHGRGDPEHGARIDIGTAFPPSLIRVFARHHVLLNHSGDGRLLGVREGHKERVASEEEHRRLHVKRQQGGLDLLQKNGL